MAESRVLPPALLALTFSTGLVDAVSVLGLGQVFTANMTGNVVFLGFAPRGRAASTCRGAGRRSSRSSSARCSAAGSAPARPRSSRGTRAGARRGDGDRGRAAGARGLVRGRLRTASLAPRGRLYAILVLCAVAMGLATRSCGGSPSPTSRRPC
jgi:hypothetical protein